MLRIEMVIAPRMLRFVIFAARCFLFLLLGLPSAQPRAGTLAQFQTPLGTIHVELLDADKPVTVRNFLRYTEAGRYTNMFFHRWVPGFVVQGGGFHVATRPAGSAIEPVEVWENITNEFNAGARFGNLYGTLAMARVSGQTNSANSQWFFNLADNGALDGVDGGFTVFGRVIHGTNVLNRFNQVSITNGIFRLQLQNPLHELPVLSQKPTLDDLVYANIQILKLQMSLAEGGLPRLRWTSVSNQVNTLEAADSLPPVWLPLFQTNGHGGTVEFVDRNRPSPARLYRVRVDY